MAFKSPVTSRYIPSLYHNPETPEDVDTKKLPPMRELFILRNRKFESRNKWLGIRDWGLGIRSDW